MNLTDRLSKHLEDIQKLYPGAIWYGKKSDLDDIDDPGAILTYTTENHGADAQPHFSMVTLVLYLTNNDSYTYELTHVLGYEAVREVSIDGNFNVTAAYQKRVVVL